MEFLLRLDSNAIIVLLSAILAAAAFVGFALPLLARKEKKQRYKEVIEKKRRQLFEAPREQAGAPRNKAPEQLSAAKSIALFYRIQRLAGAASLSARNL